MVNTKTPPPITTLSRADKLLAVTSITTLVSIKLDLAKSNYSTWAFFFFKSHCDGLKVLDHITALATSLSDVLMALLRVQERKERVKRQALSGSELLDVANTKPALDAWYFLDNKKTKTIALKDELRVLDMGDMTVDKYFAKIESIGTFLSDLGSPMDYYDLVTYAIHGLSDRFAHVAGIIAYRVPFPDLEAHYSTTPHQAQQSAYAAQHHVLSALQYGSSSFSGYNGQETNLPQAFNTPTLQDFGQVGWNMDTCVSSHLNSDANNLSTIYNHNIYPFVFVGNVILSLSPQAIFTRDNKVSIEFDEFGFSVKDYLTRQILLRCDSTGDLYPITTSSSYPQDFLASHHTWHQRLGHPRNEVLRSLLSINSILYNKVKSPQLCHACQLGKHARLPFSVSNIVVNFAFDIVHSDLWTSPLPSQSGIKYYVIFLNHYSHYLWVYPLRS
ncbi:ribonuclease H-like domain-containing protein [Tanacetum coccineum]